MPISRRVTWNTSFALCLLLTGLGGSLLRAQLPSLHIHVDQFGYLPAAEKVAVLSDPQVGFNSGLSYTPGAQLEVREASTDAIVLTAPPVAFANGSTHPQSGDRGWWVDFSALTTPGEYYLFDPSQGERSARFSVSENPYQQALYHGLRAFYYNRANVAKVAPYAEANWTDGNSFLYPGQDADCRLVTAPNDPSTARDLSGGWFDAGDQNKYVTFAEVVVHDLLSAYEENPLAFAASSNVPESGNALPDVLDEVKVETDWLLKMSAPDGSTIIKMGNISYADNANTPPSANRDPRYYGPTCTAAELAASGMLAHAALVFNQEPSLQTYANDLRVRAEACFAQALPELRADALDLACDDGTIKSGDADRSRDQQHASAIVAAVYLRQLNPTATLYDDVLADFLPPLPWHDGYYWSPYESHVNTALLSYLADPNADATLQAQLERSLQSTIDGQEFFGWNARDLYRASQPDWSYHWGSNQPKARMAFFNLQAHRAGYTKSDQSLLQRGTEMLHYFHGVNPLGLTMLSNMGAAGAERSVEEIYHAWFWDGSDWENARTSRYGPAPGFVTGGPNAFYTELAAHDPSLVPPVGQPPMKSYLDNNDNSRPGGGDNAIYSINEPAIYYQSAYLRLLAHFVNSTTPLPAELLRFAVSRTSSGISLDWSVGSEVDVLRYRVERGATVQDFQEIGRVAATGSNRSYNYLDNMPLAGLAYYRLAVEDGDGTLSYSPIRSLVGLSTNHEVLSGNTCPLGEVNLSPNPTRDEVLLRVPNLKQVQQLRLVDRTGRELRSWSSSTAFAKTSTPLSISLHRLPQGLYYLQATCPRGTSTYPIAKE